MGNGLEQFESWVPLPVFEVIHVPRTAASPVCHVLVSPAPLDAQTGHHSAEGLLGRVAFALQCIGDFAGHGGIITY